MAPHAISPLSANGFTNGSYEHDIPSARTGSTVVSPPRQPSHNHSHLRHTGLDELHDLICIGFGPASLAIAVALHDALDSSTTSPGLASLRGRAPKVAFLERQAHFAWHAGMLLEGAKMQISFIKDMATLRNPRSEFTFLNYLHRNNRLVEFTNLSTFLPQRIEYEDYMRWCANWFEDVVEYNQEVVEVVPEKSSKGTKTIDLFVVKSKNLTTGAITTRRAKHVVIAAGGKPNIPKPFPQGHPRVIHSSQYSKAIPNLLNDPLHPYSIAVIGGGQSAAEIFDNLHSHYPNSKTRLIIRGAALRPSDDSPFVNEVFNPERVSSTFSQDPTIRAASIALDRNTNYGVVRLPLIERIYETLYMQRLRHASEEEWPHRILPYRTITGVEDLLNARNGVRLHIYNGSGKYGMRIEQEKEAIDVDVVIVAAGYKRDSHEEMLKNARHLMPGGDAPEKKWTVRRDYGVQLEPGMVSKDAGIWLQGCNEHTHGLSDTLLSILAVRGGEIIQSIFGGTQSANGRIENGLNGRSQNYSNAHADEANGHS